MSTCYRDDEGWFLKARHLEHPDGWEGSCPGCQPCPARHCGECREGVHLGFGENTCPSCIGKTRDDLRELVELHAMLPEEAVEKGVHSEAANLCGPFADPEAWQHRRVARATQLDVLVSDLPTFYDDDEHHPRAVLKRWVQALEEDYGDTYDRTDDMASLTDWIDARLGRIANDVGQDFGLFKREVRKCKAHLEAVLHAGEQIERGAPCPACSEKPGVQARKLRLVRVESDTSGASDKWVCQVDADHVWTEANYRKRVGTDYIAHAENLTATDMAKQHGIKRGSLSGWASKGQVRKRGKDHSGRQLYSVADALAMRDGKESQQSA